MGTEADIENVFSEERPVESDYAFVNCIVNAQWMNVCELRRRLLVQILCLTKNDANK